MSVLQLLLLLLLLILFFYCFLPGVEVKESLLSARMKSVRHNRVLDIRKKIQSGWKMPDLISYCLINLDVSKTTATSYIDEAAEPFRKKYEESQKNV